MRDMRARLARLSIAVAAGMAMAAGTATAQSVEEFYRGKQIRVIISTQVGGDYDAWARLVTRHMAKYMPGSPSFVPQNMPGGGGIIAANHLFNQAPRDGTVIGMIGRNLPFQALVKEENIKFDPVKFNYIGSPELTSRVCTVMEGAAVQKAEDLFSKELLVGGAGAGTAVTTTPTLLSKLLGMKFKVVEGYGGSNNVVLAMERGEVHGICQTISSLRNTRPEWFASGKLKVLFNTERNPIPGVNAPSVFSFAKTEEQRRILALYSSSVELGRPMVTPPDVPADRLTALRKAFVEAMADPELKAEAAKLSLEVAVVTGEELTELIKDLMSTPEDTVNKMKTMTK